MYSLDGRSGNNKGGLTQRILWNERRNMRNGGPSQAATLEKENEQAWRIIVRIHLRGHSHTIGKRERHIFAI
jgi:hypothetical protein